MTKYLILWNAVKAGVPEKTEDRSTQLLRMVQEDLKAGKMKDWGIFAEGGAGYAIFEGSETDLALEAGKYRPNIEGGVHTVLTVDQQMEVLRKLAQSAPR